MKRRFLIRYQWGDRAGWRTIEAGTVDKAVIDSLPWLRHGMNWRGPKPLTLTLTVTPERGNGRTKRVVKKTTQRDTEIARIKRMMGD